MGSLVGSPVSHFSAAISFFMSKLGIEYLDSMAPSMENPFETRVQFEYNGTLYKVEPSELEGTMAKLLRKQDSPEAEYNGSNYKGKNND